MADCDLFKRRSTGLEQAFIRAARVWASPPSLETAMRMHTFLASATLIAFTTAAVVQTTLSSCSLHKDDNSNPPGPPFSINQIGHIVVIYQENWSIDALYSQYAGANGLRFNTPLSTSGAAPDGTPIYPQVDYSGTPIATMPPPTDTNGNPFTSTTFTGTTMPVQFYNLADFNGNGSGGGNPWADADTLTNDVTHRFVHDQLQIDGGRNDGFIFWSDISTGVAPGGANSNALTLSGVDITAPLLPTAQLASQYVLCDNCFQSAFGGSFLNHQFLIAAQAPIWPANATTPFLPTTGTGAGVFVAAAPYPPNPALISTPLVPTSATSGTLPGALTPTHFPVTFAANPGPGGASAGNATTTQNDGNWDLVLLNGGLYAPLPNTNAGDLFAVNTVQPPFPPTSASSPAAYAGDGSVPAKYLPPQTHNTIGTLLDGAGVNWKWYAEGWTAMNVAYTPGSLTATPNPTALDFQFHHQPFNFFAAFDPSTTAGLAERTAHLADLTAIYSDLAGGTLPPVSFVKFAGDDNEHPEESGLARSETAVYNLVKAIQGSTAWANTVIIITYDEFGGRFDHVPPPIVDNFGPGHRIPVIIVSPFAKYRYVDHTQYETCSILSLIEARWNLTHLTARDANAAYFFNPFMNAPGGNG
jgi:acid phosphatase